MSSNPADEWGPPLWAQFHEYALQYPTTPTTEDMEAAHEWYVAFEDIIPCDTCSTKYGQLMESQYMLTSHHLGSRTALFEWTVTLHNVVNMYLHKPLVSLQEAKTIHGF